MWIDSHCHLNHAKIAPLGTAADIVSAARAAGVSGMLTICCRASDEFSQILSIAGVHDNLWCTLGTHPHEAGKPEEIAIAADALCALANSSAKVIGIGETGLDYHYNFASPEDQKASFRKHLKVCLETDLPVIIHAREADDDIIAILREEGGGGKLRGVLHSFSSGAKMAEEALEMGFYVSFSGMVTFKNADDLRDIARRVPMDRILVETDAPYLAPVPHRGAVNQPSYVPHTGAFLAQLHGVSAEAMAAQTTENFFRLFTRARLSQAS